MSLPVCTTCGVAKAGQHFVRGDDGKITGTCKRCAGALGGVAR